MTRTLCGNSCGKSRDFDNSLIRNLRDLPKAVITPVNSEVPLFQAYREYEDLTRYGVFVKVIPWKRCCVSAGIRLGEMRATAALSASGVSSGMGISGPYGPSGWALTVTSGTGTCVPIRYRR